MKNLKKIFFALSATLIVTTSSAYAGCSVPTGHPGIVLTCRPGGFTCHIAGSNCQNRTVYQAVYIPANYFDIRSYSELVNVARDYCRDLGVAYLAKLRRTCLQIDGDILVPEFPEILIDSFDQVKGETATNAKTNGTSAGY